MLIRSADAIARLNFTYRADPLNEDRWRSYADAALDGRPWIGDCDDLASTVLDILGREGVPLEHRFRMLVSTRRDNRVDHMVAGAVENGKIWVCGDTFAPTYQLDQMRHQPISYQRLDWIKPGLQAYGLPLLDLPPLRGSPISG